MQIENYPYSNLPLTPAVAEYLILELFKGKQAQRFEIIALVVATHQGNKGTIEKQESTTSTIKKALRNLMSKGLSSNPLVGFWRIQDASPDIDSILTDESTVTNDIEISNGSDIFDVGTDVFKPLKEIGTGEETVYMYYYPAYKKLAELENRTTWPCKIGRTSRNPLTRIWTQVGTALPEKPVKQPLPYLGS